MQLLDGVQRQDIEHGKPGAVTGLARLVCRPDKRTRKRLNASAYCYQESARRCAQFFSCPDVSC
jgi:hypothetical protein